MGVPEGALTALLVLVAGLSLVPYVSGREFGPYTVPQILPPSTYWALTLSTPIVWLLLLSSVCGSLRQNWRRPALIVGCLELVAFCLAYAAAPIVETREFSARLIPRESTRFKLMLPSAQQLEAVLTKIKPRNEIYVSICGATDDKNCKGEQRDAETPFVRYLPKGQATFHLFNFARNPPVDVVLSVKYVRRRFL